MENLQQIVMQIKNTPEIRCVAQYGNDILPTDQKFIKYDELNSEEKKLWQDFLNMIINK